MSTISELRKQIDVLDAQMLKVLEERVSIVQKVRKIKEQEEIPYTDLTREEEIISNAQKGSSLSEESVETILRHILQISKQESQKE